MEHSQDHSSAREGGSDYPSNSTANLQTPACTLESYAEDKGLPPDFLKSQGLSTITYSGAKAVRIPYMITTGPEPAVRIRTALKKKDKHDNCFCWKKGAKLCLYGVWRLRTELYIIVVEGESDCHTLWYHGVNAVGVPGASNWNEARDAQHLVRYDKIYVLIEPDRGGDATLAWISQSSLRDRIYLVRLGGFKDPSAMHVADPKFFQERWQAALDAAVPWCEEESKRQDTQRGEAWEACKHLACEPDILAQFAAALLRAGLVGVEREAKILFLVLVSRLLKRPISVAVKGLSSAGKSHLVQLVLSFFPPDAYHALTAMSEHALAYSDVSLVHRMLVLFEAEGMSGDTASYLIRSLLSEGCIRYETVEKTPHGMRPRLLEREGPTGLILTTTRESLHPENETRWLSLTVADNQEQTRAIMRAIADEDRRDAVDRQPWIALQHFLGASGLQVTIPFAPALVELIPPVAVRLRRDTNLLLNLIRAHTLLHQANRSRDEQGRLVAAFDDYKAVYDLVADLLAEGVQATVRKSIKETVAAVASIAEKKDEASVTEVAKLLCIDTSAASRRCTTAAKHGYIRNEESRERQTARYVLAEPLPDDQPLLPRPAILAAYIARIKPIGEAVCRYAGKPEGIDTPPPSSSDSTDHRREIL